MTSKATRGPGRPRFTPKGTRKVAITMDMDLFEMVAMIALRSGEPISRVCNRYLRQALQEQITQLTRAPRKKKPTATPPPGDGGGQ